MLRNKKEVVYKVVASPALRMYRTAPPPFLDFFFFGCLRDTFDRVVRSSPHPI